MINVILQAASPASLFCLERTLVIKSHNTPAMANITNSTKASCVVVGTSGSLTPDRI